jgi:Family of unknown function (DUF6882)
MWDDLLTTAMAYLHVKQERLKSEFDLGRWQRYDYDQDGGTLTFSSDGRIGVVADMHIVGSTSRSGGTWLWSWDNGSILDRVKHCMTLVREYGEQHGFEKLTTAKWPGGEGDGWEMTAVAAYVLEAEGAYRAPHDNGALFMVLQRVRRTDGS